MVVFAVAKELNRFRTRRPNANLTPSSKIEIENYFPAIPQPSAGGKHNMWKPQNFNTSNLNTTQDRAKWQVPKRHQVNT